MTNRENGTTKPILAIVDDERDVAEFIRDVAEDIGFDVCVFHDGSAFEEAFGKQQAAAVILDLHLPGHDGVEVLRFLGERYCRAKIIVASGTDSRTIAAAQTLGKQHNLDIHPTPLSKPILVEDLEQVLAPLVDHGNVMNGADIRRAIENDELTVLFQPKVNLLAEQGARLDGVEALVRWQRPGYGMIPPDVFLPVVQAENLMVEVTETVIDKAISAAKSWRTQDLDITVSINLDGALFNDLSLPDRIHAKAFKMQVPTKNLTMEVTESAAMSDPAATMDILTRLRVKGFNVSMDDFGTGYSSLVQLYRLPFNELKIDKSFVMDIGNNKEADIIVETLSYLGRKLGLKICAEGIETQAMLEFVKNCGCHLGQGYLFSKPVEEALIANLAGRYLPPQEGKASVDNVAMPAPQDNKQAPGT